MRFGGPTITGRLLKGLVVPMAGLALVLGAGGTVLIYKSVEVINDRLLNASARAIAESLSVEGGKVALDLPAAAFGVLESDSRENIYYSVRYGDTLLTGYADLPRVGGPPLKEGNSAFAYGDFRDQSVRIVAEARQLPGIEQLVIVEVAETLDGRRDVTRRMLIALAFLEIILIGVSCLLIPAAVRWGLLPLVRLRGEMEQRSASDFTRLSQDGVPRELHDLVDAFNDLLGRLDQATDGVRRFTADASHQMRTPLGILKVHVAVLRGSPPGSQASRGSIDDIAQATDRLHQLVVQLLALSRAEGAGQTGVDLAALDLHRLVAEVATDYADQALDENIDLQFDAPPAPVLALAEPVLARELIGNLIDNALRYSGSGHHVWVALRLADDGVDVVIEDDGPGIPAADRERVFARFVRLDRNRARNGTGLGLPVVRALAIVLQADVVLDSGRDGDGLKVTVRFRAPADGRSSSSDSFVKANRG